MADVAIQVVLLVLNILNVKLHAIGSYLLFHLYKNGRDTAQHAYLINLSICEATMNFLEAVRRILSLSDGHSPTIKGINEYILIVMFTGIALVYYLDMMYLTLDRLLDILLNIKYPIYWNEYKAKRSIYITWVAGILLSLIMSIIHFCFPDYKWNNVMFMYFYPTLDFIVIAIALVTFVLIFKAYRHTRTGPAGDLKVRQQSVFIAFSQSRFYISVLLISTFIVFMIIPDLTFLFVAVINNNYSAALEYGCWISYALSNLLDAWIYIFMQAEVRRILVKQLHIKIGRNFSTYVSRVLGSSPPQNEDVGPASSPIITNFNGPSTSKLQSCEDITKEDLEQQKETNS